MKKLVTMLFAVGALTLAACQVNNRSAKDTEANMKAKSYETKLYTYDAAKELIKGLNYDAGEFSEALYASKGQDDDYDFLLAFYFADADKADKFISNNSSENLGMMNRYAQEHLGSKYEAKCGIFNNVAYVGSKTSFTVAFGEE